jgi:hypothetical protein
MRRWRSDFEATVLSGARGLRRARPRPVTRGAGRAGTGHRSCPSAAVRDGYGQRRPPSRASSNRDGSSRAIAASFSLGRAGLGLRAAGAADPPAATPARQPPTPRAWAKEARWPAWRGDGQDGCAPRSPAIFPEGGRAGSFLVAVCGPRSRSARGRRARHAECSAASAKRWLVQHSACRVPRLFAPGLRRVAR